MNNMAKLPLELSVLISRARFEAAQRYGHRGILTGPARYCGRQVARMATAGHYGFPRPTGSVRIRGAAPLGYGTTPISSSGVYANLTTASPTSRMRLQPSKWINFCVGDSRSTRDLLRGSDPHFLTRDLPSGKVRRRRTVFAGSKSRFLRPQPANTTVRFHLRDKGMAATIVLRFGVVQFG